MNYLGNLFFILIYRLRLQNHQPNSATKSTWSMWIALKLPPVTEKSEASIKDLREYDIVMGLNYLYFQIVQNQGFPSVHHMEDVNPSNRRNCGDCWYKFQHKWVIL